MKRSFIISALSASIIILTAATASAQKKHPIGIRLEAGITDVRMSRAEGLKSTIKPGAALSVFAGIPLKGSIYLQPELLLSYSESGIRSGDYKTKYKYGSVSVPVLVTARIEAGSGTVLIGVGPQVGYGFSADSALEKMPDQAKDKNIIEIDHWYAGASATAGYEFRNRIGITAAYRVGYDIGRSKKSGPRSNYSLNLGVSYRF